METRAQNTTVGPNKTVQQMRKIRAAELNHPTEGQRNIVLKKGAFSNWTRISPGGI
jgi:hypothetical protein